VDLRKHLRGDAFSTGKIGHSSGQKWPSFRLSRLLLRAGGSEQRIQVFGKQLYVDLWDSAVSTNLFLNRV
jgi:hypothetical protein